MSLVYHQQRFRYIMECKLLKKYHTNSQFIFINKARSRHNNISIITKYIYITHISYYSFIHTSFKFCFSLPCHFFKTVLNTKWNRKNKSVITKEIKQDREGVCGGLSQDRWEMQFFSIFDERYLNSRMKSVFIVWGVKLWVANV